MSSPEGAGAGPLVSIGLPAYNGGAYLEASIRSLLDQSYRHIELIISDNASTDGSSEVCQRLAAEDPRIVYVLQPQNIGGVGNHNAVRALAKGEFFMWASCDDLWKPTYVERCVDVLRTRPDVVLAYTVNARIDEHSAPLPDIPVGPRLDADSAVDRFVLLAEMYRAIEPFYGLIRRSALERCAMMTLHPGFDRILLTELGLHGKMVQLPEALYVRRIHGNQSINAFPSLRSRYRWINPRAQGRFVWPHFAYAWHFARAALRSAPGWRQRAACMHHMLRWCNWHREELWEDLRGAD
jgi:glycosyltransferase involved in cell wall biosynthesis